MYKTPIFQLILIIALLFGGNASAAAPQWDIDNGHSGFYFRINHIFSKVQGFFSDYSGTIAFDPNNLEESRLEFEVKVKSVDTQIGKRDNDLRSANFFDSKKYPTMTFKSESITRVKDDQYTVEGILTIKDVSQKVKVPFTFFGTKPHPFNPNALVAGFEAKMTIDRLAYNVGNGKFYKMGTVGKDVDVFITIEATRNK